METAVIVGIGIVAVCLILFIVLLITGTTQKGLEKELTKWR